MADKLVRVTYDDGTTEILPESEIAGTAQPSLGAAFLEGAKSAPSAFIESAGGLIPLYKSAEKLISGDRAEGAKDIAQIGAGMGGAAIGGTLGAMTGPLSPIGIPAGAYAGGTIGTLVSEALRRYGEGQEPLSAEEAAYVAGQGAPLAAIGQSAKLIGSIKKGGYTLPERLTQKAVGITKGELGKSARRKGMGAEGEIQIAESLKNIAKEPEFRKVAADPMKLKGFLEDGIARLENTASNEVKRLEGERSVTPKFRWNAVQKLIKDAEGSGQARELQNRVAEIVGNISQETNLKSLSGLDKARKALNKTVYNKDDLVTNAVLDAIRKDIRQTQMRMARQIDPRSSLEKTLLDEGDRIQLLKRAVEPKIVTETSRIPQPRQAIRTSGGLGVPLLVGATTQNPLYAMGAAGLNYLFESPEGQLLLSDVLSGKTTPGTLGFLQRAITPSLRLSEMDNE